MIDSKTDSGRCNQSLLRLAGLMLFAYDVTFPESSAVAHSCPPEPEDNDSELTSTTALETSDDEMSADGDAITDAKDDEQPREPMRSEGSFVRAMSSHLKRWQPVVRSHLHTQTQRLFISCRSSLNSSAGLT